MKEIQWFPGHMAKTRRMMEENISLVDVVVEIVDARAPYSSKNPYLDNLWKRRPRVIVMGKSDLADEAVTKAWRAFYKEQGFAVVEADIVHGRGTDRISREAANLLAEKRAKLAQKGMKNPPVRMMITGIPNVGKSTLINQLSKRSDAAKTGNKPGVTKSKQWIRLTDGSLLLDTPGILWPKFEDQHTGLLLSYIGSISDEILDTYSLASSLLEKMALLYPALLETRYKLDASLLAMTGDHMLEEIGRKRGHLKSGGIVDTERTAVMVLDEFRNGKIGRMTLERPEDLLNKEPGKTEEGNS